MCVHMWHLCVLMHMCVYVCMWYVRKKGMRWGRGRGFTASKRSAACGYCIERETESHMGEWMDGGLD